MTNKFMNAQEVADVFFEGKWSYQKVLRWARQGDLPGMKAGKSYIFSTEALIKWASENLSTATWAKVKI